ncbi:phosphate ABC transporter substrate-binding protein PstS [Cognatilysobacter lacus]|uniref:Phosphate-binding protein PstS n=1 Tax=Cognatilysobacter lacus TaxID=1643323 RepID=A0A5D8Z4J4_9GAMM|nr:phosphate ABC transporter substrate-binding protein PstS [Lysobacter lacus]TZF89032.1 phosphate ABC transporter substrate-binding protein PstS [Lysobacter lacus]
MNLALKSRLAAALLVASAAFTAHATDVTGAGSSFVYPVLSKWSGAYATATGNRVNYQSIGSGGGIAQIKAATVDFGASDKPLSPQELKQFGLGQFPIVIGGIVPVINVPGVQPGAMKLDGPTLARIFLGEITMWNDPAIAALNGGLQLPAQKITVVHRSDGSGTTFNFTNYLSKVSPGWKAKAGEGTAVEWPAGIGGKGNEGVAAYVRQIRGGIGYVEYAYALQNKLSFSRMKNRAGNFVQPRDDSFAAAASTADWSSAPDFNVIMTDAPGAEAWPITATTWAIMYKKAKRPAQSKAALDFFRWAYQSGKGQAAQLDYVPLPDPLVQKINAYWTANMK